MPMDRGTPDLVRHCVAAVAKEYGGDVNRAFAICVASLQKAGYLKAGTMELTAAGKKKEKEHEMEPDAAKKLKAYEKLLKQAREARKEESYDDLDRYLNPRNRTGLEDTPRAIARKYETVSKGESSMDFMRRMAGITTRYEDRAVQPQLEAKLSPKEEKALVAKLTKLILKGNEAAEDKFHKELEQKYGKSVAADIADAAQQAAADDDYGAASDDMDYAQGMGRYAEGRLAEGLEQKLMTALENAGFDSHDFHFEDGLIAKDMTTALDMTYALAKAGFGVRTGVTLSPVSGKSVKIEFKS